MLCNELLKQQSVVSLKKQHARKEYSVVVCKRIAAQEFLCIKRIVQG